MKQSRSQKPPSGQESREAKEMKQKQMKKHLAQQMQNKCYKWQKLPQVAIGTHDFGVGKGGNIGQEQTVFPVPSEEDKERWEAWFSKSGVLEARRVRVSS